MPKTVNPDPAWTDTLSVPVPHETMDADDVAVPDTRLLANDKWLKKHFGDRLDALERAVWPTGLNVTLTAAETDTAQHVWRFDYAVSTSRGSVTSARLDYGDGTAPLIIGTPGTPGQVLHDYPDTGGSYTATLTATNSEGMTQTAQRVITVADPTPDPDPDPAPEPEPQTYSSVMVYSEALDFPDGSTTPMTAGQTGGRVRAIYPRFEAPAGELAWTNEGSQALPRAITAKSYETSDGSGGEVHYFRDTDACMLDISPAGAGGSAVQVQLQFSSPPVGHSVYLEYGGTGAPLDGAGEFAWTDSQVLTMPITASVAFELDSALLTRGESKLLITVSNQGEAEPAPVLSSVTVTA